MSGHSKWHTIKHKKGAADAKRGKIFTRLIKELTVAARNGGGDPDMNPRLRTVIADAKQVNMPADNIKRAIRRGTGEEEGVSYDEVTYEGYGPGGVAVLIEALTDNKNRTVGEIRHTFTKWGGKLGDPNSVARMFHKRSQIVVEKAKASEEALMDAVLNAGADDMNDDGEAWEIVSAPDVHPAVLEAVKALGVEPVSAEVAMVPSEYIKLEGKQAQQMLKLMDALEEHDDTKNVWSNFDVDEKEIEASRAGEFSGSILDRSAPGMAVSTRTAAGTGWSPAARSRSTASAPVFPIASWPFTTASPNCSPARVRIVSSSRTYFTRATCAAP